ncbi:uncharacterized protein [Callorhinus ursinus]|uniref:uncharacterized protein isoform X1 n=1 Tax=Callorhinus ursinus TaxID=34884 RepID=UPI003CD02A4B
MPSSLCPGGQKRTAGRWDRPGPRWTETEKFKSCTDWFYKFKSLAPPASVVWGRGYERPGFEARREDPAGRRAVGQAPAAAALIVPSREGDLGRALGLVILEGRRRKVESACPSSPIFRAFAGTQVANSGRRTACPGGFGKGGPLCAGRPLPSKYASPSLLLPQNHRTGIVSRFQVQLLKTRVEMQTKGNFLFTEGPPPGPSISLFLCLPPWTKPPCWALKARFSAVNILRGLFWHPEKRLE